MKSIYSPDDRLVGLLPVLDLVSRVKDRNMRNRSRSDKGRLWVMKTTLTRVLGTLAFGPLVLLFGMQAVQAQESTNEFRIPSVTLNATEGTDGTTEAIGSINRVLAAAVEKDGNIAAYKLTPKKSGLAYFKFIKTPTAAGFYTNSEVGPLTPTTVLDADDPANASLELEITGHAAVLDADGNPTYADGGKGDQVFNDEAIGTLTININVVGKIDEPAVRNTKVPLGIAVVRPAAIPSFNVGEYFDDPDGDVIPDASMSVSTLAGGNNPSTARIVSASVAKGVLSFKHVEFTGESPALGIYRYLFTLTVAGVDGTLDIILDVKLGVNNPPQFRGALVSSSVKCSEGRLSTVKCVGQSDGGIPVVGSTNLFVGRWIAEDLDENDVVSYEFENGKSLMPLGTTGIAVHELLDNAMETNTTGGDVWLSYDPASTGRALDYDTVKEHTFKLVAVDRFGGKDEISITIELTPVDEGPYSVDPKIKVQRLFAGVEGSDTYSVDLAGSIVDPEGDDITYAVKSSDDKVATATLEGTTVTVKGVAAGDATVTFTGSNMAEIGTVLANVSFDVKVKAGDNTAPYFKVGDILYTEVAGSVAEDDKAGTVVGTYPATEDDGDTDVLTYSVVGTTAFAVSNAGAVTVVANQLNFEAKALHEFVVAVNDGWGGEAFLNVVVSVSDANDAPTVNTAALPTAALMVTAGSSIDVNANAYFNDEDAVDAGRLRFTATPTKEGVVDVDIAPNGIVVITGEAVGMTKLLLVAQDSKMAQTSTMIDVETTANMAPTVANPIADQTIEQNRVVFLTLGDVFADAEGDVTVTGAMSADKSVALVILIEKGARLALVGVSTGSTTVTVSAADASGTVVSDEFAVTVSAPSAAAIALIGSLPDQTVTVGIPEIIDLSNVFEVGGTTEVLSYSWLSSDTDVLSVDIHDDTMTLDGKRPGNAQIVVTAKSSDGSQITDSFAATIETAPSVVGTIASVLLELGDDAISVDFDHVFNDEDGDLLSYQLTMSPTEIVVWEMAGMSVQFLPVSAGEGIATITATDPAGRSTSTSFGVTVQDDALRSVAKRSLAGFGSAVLSSTSNAIANRIENAEQTTDLITDTGVNGGSFKNVDMFDLQDLSEFTSNPQQSSAYHNGSLPRDFAFSVGAKTDGSGQLAVWSTSDRRSYESDGFQGMTLSTHIGLDFIANQHWMFGVSVANHSAENDYAYKAAERTMDTSLTNVVPYVRYNISPRTNTWALVGIGQGRLETQGGISDTNDRLNSNMVLIGARHELASVGNVELAVRGDAGAISLRSSGTEDLEANVSRIRAGLESSMTFESSRFGTYTPYVEVGVRNEGADSDVGTAMEAAGGFRLSSGALNLDANGRVLRSGQFEETGYSLTATLNPNATASGLSMSISPRWGASSEFSNRLWNDQLNMLPSVDASSGFAMSTRIQYGAKVANESVWMKPYVDLEKGANHDKRLLVGLQMNPIKVDNNVRLEVSAGTVEDRIGAKSNIVLIRSHINL